MPEYQIGHMYYRPYKKINGFGQSLTDCWRLMKITTIVSIEEEPVKFLIRYSSLASNVSWNVSEECSNFFVCKSLELGEGTKEVFIRDLPLYIDARILHPEFKKILAEA